MEQISKTDDGLATSLALPQDVISPPWLQVLVNENQRLRDGIQAAADRMARLQAVAAGLVRAVTVQDVVETIVSEGIRAFDAVNGVVYLASDNGRALETPFALGMDPRAFDAYRRLDVDAELPPSIAYRERRSLVISSKGAAREQFPAVKEMQRSMAQSWLALPIIAGNSVLGSIVFGFGSHVISVEDEALGTALSHQCAVALERARLFEAERQARARADEANRAKMDFLAVMSHELRTPLTAIGGFAQLLELGVHGAPNAQQMDAVSRIQRSQRHLLRLINDVLSFAKIDAGRVELNVRDVGLRDILVGLEPMIVPLVTQRMLVYACKPVDPALMIHADADKVRQILLNLVTNAVKFTPAGGAIDVAATVKDDVVEIAVVDNGRGIPADKRDAIFEPFVQLDVGKTRTSEGTGLGLAISRDLARAMKGDIAVESEVGKGSVFTLTLPRKSDQGPR